MEPKNTQKAALASLLSLSVFLGACGLIGEKEAPAPTARLESQASSCKLPSAQELIEPKGDPKEFLLSATDCVQAEIDRAFKQVRGENPEELTLDELKSLKRQGLVELPISSVSEWNALEGGLRFFHSEGRAALKRSDLEKALLWVRTHVRLYADSIEMSRKKGDLDELPEDYFPRLYDAVEGLGDLLSGNGRTSLAQAREILTALKDTSGTGAPTTEQLRRLESVWVLKQAFFESADDFRSKDLGQLLRICARAAREAPLTLRWLIQGGSPATIPIELPQEWARVTHHFRDYFLQGSFVSIDRDQLRWALRGLDPQSTNADLADDLVRISQRLSPRKERSSGFHPAFLDSLLATFPSLAQSIIDAATGFPRCRTAYDGESEKDPHCIVTLKHALSHRTLKRIAVKGPNRIQSFGGNPYDVPTVPRGQGILYWEDAIGRLFERNLIGALFAAFDRDRDGKIKLEARSSAESKEALDLAYTFLRFASVEKPKIKKPGDAEEVSLPSQVTMKPSALSGILGIVGDRWMPDGNSDGSLDADEFFSIIKINGLIQDDASKAGFGSGAEHYKLDREGSVYDQLGGPIFSRTDLIKKFRQGLAWYQPFMNPVLKKMNSQRLESLFHALISAPDPAAEPITVYKNWERDPKPIELRQWVQSDATLAPVALVTLIDRLMFRCDLNDDSRLTWRELDCATSLIVSASHQVVSSGLIELDPIVNDGSQLFLKFLTQPGIPQSIAKLVIANGSISKLNLGNGVLDQIQSSYSASWNSLASMVGAPLGATPATRAAWAIEAQKRYGRCDSNHDQKLSGRELDCLASAVIGELEKTLRQLEVPIPTESLESFIREAKLSDVVKTGIILASNPEQTDQLLSELSSSPESLLLLTEEIIRRGKPLCEEPGC